MALSGRTAIRIGAVVVGLGFLAWHQFQPKEQDAAAIAPTVSSKPQSPAKPRTWQLGSVTLTACELSQPNSGLSTAAW